MDLKAILDQYERRARIAGAHIHDAVDRAGIRRSTYWRWRRKADGNGGGRDPRMNTLREVEMALHAIEAERAGESEA